MRHTEFHGFFTGNTIRRVRKYVNHHGKGIVCEGPNCWFFAPKNGGLCMTAGVKWGYSSRKNSHKFQDGYSGRSSARCAYHSHRMCFHPVPKHLTTHKKRVKKYSEMNIDCDENVFDEEERGDERVMYDVIDYEEYENKDVYVEEIYDDYEENVRDICPDVDEDSDTYLDQVYSIYEKMREDEFDLDEAYNAYNKMREDWVLV